ncbi:transposase [Streptomyces sp. NPDC015242]|uniref:transposase n=1 Tax=Streptomyces sp. NPDC015242 TaxID=3364951 RepID=UPI003701AF12
MRNYPPQFKADAIVLYESRPEATIRSAAADPGIDPKTLRNWVRAAGVSRPRGRRTQEPAQPPPRWRRRTPPCGRRSASDGHVLSSVFAVIRSFDWSCGTGR